MLSTNKKNNDGTLVHIKLPNILPEIFQIILRYIYMKDSTEILGGYNPIEWNSDCCYRATKDSFIFSFRNSDDIESYILSRVKNEQRAIFNSSGFGPSFDYGLILINDSGLCGKNYYENQIRETEDGFYVEEYEVFQILN
ncbi:hypothetical protein GLOIN_2v1881828 [Rhizophagus irregularis DAOM 181602=DAOM 197198]|nr:hypothetical protein GLOIN_2v1881828 [Rhizophagus irregularis DAOM 181602=DAOM 197198]